MFKIIFSDFDGTLTYKEELGPVFFNIITLLESKKAPLVIVTGRSLSWGHFLLTHIPYLKEIIVEGGGAILKREGKIITEELLVSQAEVEKLNVVSSLLPKEFPGLKLSVDSFGRKTDRAIELYDLKDNDLLNRVSAFLKSHDINFSTSNVHLNFWCGELSKYKAVTKYLGQKNTKASDCVFFGDSLNDQSMFKSFENSVGVSNISSVIDRLEYRPKVILAGGENAGPYGVLNYLKKTL